MADTYLKAVAALEYRDPVPVLVRYQELEIVVSASDLPVNVKALRTSELKSVREGREAALFALGLESVLGTKVYVALAESSDFDFVLRWEAEEQIRYCPVQLKELVSHARNPQASLAQLVQRLASRQNSTNTLLLVRINRKEDVDIGALPVHDLPFLELWFLWQSSADGSTWSILGDAKKVAYRYDFLYPTI
jgi:hypothetical protein